MICDDGEVFPLVPRVLLTLLLACTAVVLGQLPASACRCDVPAAGQAARQADVVFTGVLLGEERGNRRSTLALDVDRVFKGDVTADPAEVASPTDSCGLRLTEAQEYVVFAAEGATGLVSEKCYGTTRARERTVAAVERVLGQGAPFQEPAPPAPTYTRVLDSAPPRFTRLAAPGAALALVGLLGWLVVRRRS